MSDLQRYIELCRDLTEQAEKDRAEIDRLRATNTSLNRRCQEYERALASKVEGMSRTSLVKEVLICQMAELDEEIGRLRTMLLWIQTYEPVIVEDAEEKYGPVLPDPSHNKEE